MDAVLSHLKQGKAADVHGLRAEHIKLLCADVRSPSGMVVREYALSKHLAHTFNLCMEGGCCPEQLCLGRVPPIYKSGDGAEHDNYRCITIEAFLAKVFAMVLQSRAAAYLEQQHLRVAEQCGFRRQRSCTDQLLTLDHVLRSCKQQRQKVIALFIDFRKAFDSVPRKLLFARLQQLGFPSKYMQMLSSMYEQAVVSFCAHGDLSDPVPTHVGVLQGDPLSPTLFGVFIDVIIQYISTRCHDARVPTIAGQLLYGLLYADDLVLLSIDEHTTQQLLDALAAFCEEFGVTVNVTKSAAVIFNTTAAVRRRVKLLYKGQVWPIEDDYRYLGLVVSCNRGVGPGQGHLEQAGRRAALRVLQRCRELHITELDVALSLFDNQVLPCLTYGAEVWLPYMTCLMAEPIKAMQAPMERVQLWFLKRFLGLRNNTASWVVLAEASRAPVYLYALKQVCRLWNKLISLNEHHLAYRVFQHSIQTAKEGGQSWAGQTLQVVHRVGACASPALMLQGGIPGSPAIQLDLKAVQQAFETGLECWWSLWKNSPRYSLRVYACEFKCRYHMNREANYLFASGVSRCHKRQLLLFRCFNVKLNKHVANWEHGSDDQRLRVRAQCKCCNMGEVEDEAHVLHECPMYQGLRGRYQIPMVPQPFRFLPGNVHMVAGFLKVALHMRDNPADPAAGLGNEDDGGSSGWLGVAVGHRWWMAGGLIWFILGVAALTLVGLASYLTQSMGPRCLPGLSCNL
jgi:hypothetical protein